MEPCLYVLHRGLCAMVTESPYRKIFPQYNLTASKKVLRKAFKVKRRGKWSNSSRNAKTFFSALGLKTRQRNYLPFFYFEPFPFIEFQNTTRHNPDGSLNEKKLENLTQTFLITQRYLITTFVCPKYKKRKENENC